MLTLMHIPEGSRRIFFGQIIAIRVIAAQKANTANAFSLPGLALKICCARFVIRRMLEAMEPTGVEISLRVDA